MLNRLCKELKNYFDVERHFGIFEIENGNITLDFLKAGQYFRIVGSIFNDGIYKYPIDVQHPLKDEAFNGSIWALAIPNEIIELADRITAWEAENGSKSTSPYSSESFGGYSYVKSADGATWDKVFKSELNAWRKINELT